MERAWGAIFVDSRCLAVLLLILYVTFVVCFLLD